MPYVDADHPRPRRWAWTSRKARLPPWGRSYRWFAKFRDDGLLEKINHFLVMADRERVGREASPSGAIIRQDDRGWWPPRLRCGQEDPVAALYDQVFAETQQFLIEKYAVATAPGLTLVDPQTIALFRLPLYTTRRRNNSSLKSMPLRRHRV